MFKDRSEAADRLAEQIQHAAATLEDVVVLAIPRGALPIGQIVARALNASLDIVVVKKIGAPGNEECAIGAVDADGDVYINELVRRKADASSEYIDEQAKQRKQVIDTLAEEIRAGNRALEFAGKTVIIVDDGIATGATMKAAISYVRKQGPNKIIVAVPVASRDVRADMEKLSDQYIVLAEPEIFIAVGQFYDDFPQVSSEEAAKIFQQTRP